MGRKCLIDMAVRGVQRPGSTGNKNRRGSCFMLYILLISNTPVGDKRGGEGDGLPHG